MYQDKVILDEASRCSQLFFNWSKPFMKVSRKGQLKIDQMGFMPEKMRTFSDMEKVKRYYAENKAAGKSNSLLRAAVRAFGCDICLQTAGGLTAAILNFMSPILVLKLVNFI